MADAREMMIDNIARRLVKGPASCTVIRDRLQLVMDGLELATIDASLDHDDHVMKFREIIMLMGQMCVWPEDFDWWSPKVFGGYMLIWKTPDQVLWYKERDVFPEPHEPWFGELHIVGWDEVMSWKDLPVDEQAFAAWVDGIGCDDHRIGDIALICSMRAASMFSGGVGWAASKNSFPRRPKLPRLTPSREP